MITILDEYIEITPHAAGKKYYESKGYIVTSAGERGKFHKITIKVNDLLPNSNVYVNIHCDACNKEYKTTYQHITNNKSGYCEQCNRKYSGIGNKYGSFNKGRTVPKMQGSNHPRWNPNKTAQKLYYSKVMSITRKAKPIYKSWENYDKIGLAGVEGAYQLDHKIPIKYGFDNNIDPSIIGHIDNLQLLPWKENNRKRHKL